MHIFKSCILQGILQMTNESMFGKLPKSIVFKELKFALTNSNKFSTFFSNNKNRIIMSKSNQKRSNKPKVVSDDDKSETSSIASGMAAASIDDTVTPKPNSVITTFSSDTTSQSSLVRKTPIIKRPDSGGKIGQTLKLKTNYYPIDINFAMDIHHYDVEMEYLVIRKDGSEKLVNVKKDLKHMIIEELFKQNNLGLYVYDGQKNLYTPKKFTFKTSEKSDECQFTLKLKDTSKDVENTYKIKLKFATTVSFDALKQYLERKLPIYHVYAAINVVNLVLKQNKIKTHKIERDSIYDLSKLNDISKGIGYVTGYHLAIKGCQSGWLQNGDLDNGNFYKPLSLIDLLYELFRNVDLNKNLSENNLNDFKKFMKGLMVETTHLTNNQKHKVLDLLPSANQATFTLNTENGDRNVTVASYFEETYGKLKYPNMPCIVFGEQQGRQIVNAKYFPIEVCKISPGQSYHKALLPDQQKTMTKNTVLKPFIRANETNKVMQSNAHDGRLTNAFGIRIGNNQMTDVNARVLDPPGIFYRDKKNNKEQGLNVDKGQWRMKPFMKFYDPSKLSKWAIIWMANNNQDERNYIIERLKSMIRYIFINGGLDIQKPPIVQQLTNKTTEEIFELIEKNLPDANLIMFVIPNSDTRDKIKSLAECKSGLMTQCLLYEKICSNMDMRIDIQNSRPEDDRKFCNYISNVLLKVNAKLGGLNNIVDSSSLEKLTSNNNDAVMFFGADVTHATGDYSKPSVAAVVASLDLNYTHYSVRLSEQFHEKNTKQTKEIILQLEDHASTLISAFQKFNRVLPSKIIYYRDGVDEGQFQAVLDQELLALKSACKKIQNDYDPKITIIIVQKRHHTRFFMTDQNGRYSADNIPPGTVIDTSITTPDRFDFYLCSHQAGQGTAKPTRYWVIYDENKFTSDDIQDLTYTMCHLYVKSNKAVSIPAPVYYSHLAALRGPMYRKSDVLTDQNNNATDNNNEEDEEANLIRSRLIEIHPNLENSMFFA